MKWPFKNPLKIKKLLAPRPRKRISWKKFGRYALYVFIVFVFMTAITFAWFSKDLPTPEKIAKRSATQSTKIYDRTGQILLYETGEQKRTIVQPDQISDNLKKATVAVEDANFYNHHGFDLRGVASAVWQKLTGKTSRTRGGSTVTQQFVKNALLDSNRTMARKIKELILAIELELMYNKNEILTMYLNEIPYGNNTAGAEAAAKMYYGKTAKDLTLAQAATLAAIPKAPSYYSPYGSHTKELVKRRDYVLDRMVETGYITKEEADLAKKEDTTTLNVALQPRKETMLAPHFAMYVIEQAADEFGEEKIQKEGFKIITTLDYEKQKLAQEAINNGVKKMNQYGASNAALTSVDPKTGEILTMVGSVDYFNTGIDGNVNVADSSRQPGSSFKPYAYATAFKKKEYSPAKILYDVKTDFGGGYVPQNYNGRFNGPVTIRQALSNSLNIPAVKIMSLAGIDNVLRTVEDMGITTLKDREKYGLSLVLGAGEIKPVEHAAAFGVFADEGVKHDLKSMLKVTNASGKTVYEYNADSDKGRQVLDKQIAYEISSILSDNKARALVFGTNTPLNFPGKSIAVKTGTTTSFKDAWAVGYSRSISTAVWVGNNNATPMKNGADGSIVAAPIFHEYMDKVVTADEPFVRPEGIQDVTVDKFSTKLPTDSSPETISDIFASWQVPTDKDDIHVKVRVCKANGLLADADVPDSLAEYRTYTDIHSERPDNPNWEGPVRAWAESAGMSNSPPSEKCNPNDLTPAISITSPADGATVSGNTEISATVNSKVNVRDVSFYIDDVSIGSDNSAPFSISYNFSNLSNGRHSIQAIVTDENGTSNKTSISINIDKDTAGPKISNVSASKINSTSYKISWSTDEGSTSQVTYGTSSSYGSSSPLAESMVISHNVTITVTTGSTYYYRVISKDSVGNSSTSDEYSFTAN